MKLNPFLTCALTVLMGGCLTEGGDEGAREASFDPDPPGPGSNPATPPAEAARGRDGSTILHQESFDGYVSVVYGPLSNPLDPALFPVTLPPLYGAAVLEMIWQPTLPTNTEMSLMVHRQGGAGADAMLREIAGPSPLRMVIDAGEIPTGQYDVVVYVPTDRVLTTVIVHQPFEIHATIFDGPVPEGFTAISDG
ncbi:MAG: hypothetical protein ACT4PT_09290 [Methanobacteriota archaeon]